ncbi:MAG: phosphoenolpyruvate synthase, partial [Tidjanibacter sp.]|nr:phosphoenolpyruvate synthase [Tidjanibacter sp.]
MDYSTLEREMVVGDVNYRALMSRRIRNILLVCNSYDGFALEEDGRIESQINQEYSGLNLNNPLMIARAESTEEAMEMLSGKTEFDLIITMYNVGELDPITFSRKVKEQFPALPVVLLFSYSHAVRRRLAEQDTSSIDYIFCWQGSADLIFAIVKLIEDKMNAEHDILDVGVQAIMLVEDSVRYYSTYLPTIYKLIIQHTSASDEALNEQQSMMRKRARPKILLATSYNEALGIYQKYRENLLGVISDVGFVINNGDDTDTEKLDAGIDLCRLIKAESPLMPFLLQSSQKSVRAKADELGVGFIEKRSKTLLLQLNDYIRSEFAFGDLVFKDPETGIEVARVRDLRELQATIDWLPEKILTFGTSQNMISKWLLSRGLFFLGNMFKGVSTDHFDTTDEMRKFVIHNITEYRRYLGQAVVAKFDNKTYDDTIWFARMGNGSLGGKARGLAFLNSMLQKYHTYNK